MTVFIVPLCTRGFPARRTTRRRAMRCVRQYIDVINESVSGERFFMMSSEKSSTQT